MSLLTLVQAAGRRVGVQSGIQAVVGNPDATAMLLLELANEETTDLAKRAGWTALTREATFTTLASSEQPGALPSDFDRFVDETMFNRSLHRRVWGPVSAQEWQEIQAHDVQGTDPMFRVRGASILLTPRPPAGQTIAFEYVSSNCCRAADGAPRAAWGADSDVSLLDETILSLGVEWRFKARKGLDHEAVLRTYERRVTDAINRDGGRRTIDAVIAAAPGSLSWRVARGRTLHRVIEPAG